MYEIILSALPPIIAGICISFLMNLTGVGGGVVTIPVLNLLFGMDITASIGTASFFMGLTNVLSGIAHARRKNICFKTAMNFLLGALPGLLASAVSIVYFIHAFPDDAPEFKNGLKYFVVFIVFLSIALIFIQKQKNKKRNELAPSKTNRLGLATGGLFIGAIIGATGIGSGVLIVPALMRMTRLSTKQIVGTSVIISLLLSIFTATIYSKGGQTDFNFGLLLSIGTLIGIPLAGRASGKLNEVWLERIVIGLIFISAILMAMPTR